MRSSIARLRSIDPQAVRNYEQVDYANARLRAFAAETIEKDWWKLLWVPPSMPYFAPGSVYSPFSDGSVTKRLIFSAWSSVPTSVASLLSYEAERRMVAGSGLTENTAEARRAVSVAVRLRHPGWEAGGHVHACAVLAAPGARGTSVTRSLSWMTVLS